MLKPGGAIFAAYINRFAPVYDTLIHEPEAIASIYDQLHSLLRSGVNESSEDFTDSYFTHPAEVVPAMESYGLKTLRFLGSEGFSIQSEGALKNCRKTTSTSGSSSTGYYPLKPLFSALPCICYM